MNEPRTTPQPASHKGPDDLTPELYAELRKLAARRMFGQDCGTTIQPTMLAHEAWLKMSSRKNSPRDPRQFLAVAAATMRNLLIDRARRKARLRHGGGQVRTFTENLGRLPAPNPDRNILLIDEGVGELEKINPVWAKVVVARFFGGFSDREIAESLGISERSVGRQWAAAKVWLYRWMRTAGRQ
jgi:RNA polymerase sigma factor (TIGR02999 family)